ncbi:MAG TPA: amidohydrolase [Terriglobales bacterium]|nr:amidohydrolase [Terriglobales bacterium]
MKRTSFAAFSAAAALFLCGFGSHAAAQQSEAPKTEQETEPITLFRNAHIYTNDPQSPWAQSMLVRGGEILAIGDDAEVSALADSSMITVDLQGRFVMPGFNDAHVHVGGAGEDFQAVRLNGCASVQELQKRLAEAVAQHKEGEWITGSGWDHTFWPDKKFPNRQELDAVAPNNPVLLTHISGHVAVVNSLALKLAGITKATPNPPGGEIERDANGELDGMLKEGAAMHLVETKIPPLTMEQHKRGIEMALADVAKNGVTSIQDFSPGDSFEIYRQLKDAGKLTVRITEWLPFVLPLEKLEEMRKDGGTTDPWLKTGSLKGFLDGALGSRTAALLAPYSDDPSTSGILTADPAKFQAMAIERDKAGFQINFHAIGDRANHVALDIFAAVLRANGPRDRRDKIEHAQVVAPGDFERFAQLNVIASMQPSHETTDMRWAPLRLGPERSKGAYAWATMEKYGVRLAFGTDYDVEPISPFRGLYACVTRELPDGGPPGGWEPQEKISLADCIRAYTSGSAYAEFEEGKKGELKPGEYADFIVLSNDLTKMPPADYLKTEVLQTVIGGRTVYQKK